jgi:hypothetical protein
MNRFTPLLLGCLLLSSCSNHDDTANALDNAATQSDPTAAAELRNQADVIRNDGADADLASAASSAQIALEAAGIAAAQSPRRPR